MEDLFMSVLFCDSNSELWYDKAEELGLEVIRMPYTLDGNQYYYDLGKATDFGHFYKRMREKSMPSTQGLNKFDYIDYFQPFLEKGEDIFYITFSHQLSGTFEYMYQAIAELKEQFPERKITVFDSKSICMGCGFQVLHAAKLWKQGATDEQLLQFLNEFRKHVVVYFAVDDLFHLKRGGRLSTAAATIGTMLKLKPVLTVNDEGKLAIFSKEKGLVMVINKFASFVAEQGGRFDEYDVYVMDADCKEDGDKLAEKIKTATGGRANVVRQTIGPVIATHCGPGTVGVVFYKA
jgi:DegV family protein with EDD domain